MDKKIPYKIYLKEDEIPTQWYNVRADMKNKPAPLLNPATLQPLKAEELEPIFCKELVRQELDNDTRFVDIPEEVLKFYKMYRPSPLVRAYFLEEALGTPAKIYYKFEYLRQPQAQLCHRTGLLCKSSGPQGRNHRNRSRSVGNSLEHGLLIFRP